MILAMSFAAEIFDWEASCYFQSSRHNFIALQQ